VLPREFSRPMENSGMLMDADCSFITNQSNIPGQQEIISNPPISVSPEDVKLLSCFNTFYRT
jgi:hypothetical protein